MLITKFCFDNLYGFENFEVDLTYPRKLSFSTIEQESLTFAPAFKVKRLCIISGGNATGKTSIGRLLCAATNILCGRDGAILEYVKIRDASKQATIQLEFVTTHNQKLNNVSLVFHKSEQSVGLIRTQFQSVTITKSDSQLTSRTRLAKVPADCVAFDKNSDIDLAKNLMRKIFTDEITASALTGWNYVFYDIEDSMEHMLRGGAMNTNQATKILKAFDPSIKSIELMREDNPNAYQIKFEQGGDALLVDMGKATNALNDPTRLSKGTFEGLGIVRFIEYMSTDKMSTTYFLDERMAHVHTELEKAMLNVMIQKLGLESQFFYTSHNTDLLELEIPIHSHLFLKRKVNGLIEAVQPETIFKKNDRSLSNYVKNDVFGTCPDASLIDEIAYGD